jgi:type I site-specific deoxyribonuclease
MNKIEKLIKEMCPNGVEYKRIEEICEIIVGGDKPKTCNKELTKPNLEYPFPIYSNNSKNDGLYGFSKTYTVNKKSVSISSIGTIGFHKLREPFYTPIIRLKILIPKNIKQITPEFLNYSLDMIDFSKIGGKQDTTLPSINTSDLQNIKIPIPPIEIQNEIVKILDTFTQLEAELEAELEARDKQYQYYRNKLLDFDNNQKLLQKLFEKDNKEIDNKIE